MSDTKYRFLPSNIPGCWGVYERATETRMPGFVTMKPDAKDDPERLRYERRSEGTVGKDKGAVAVIHAPTVGELSEKLDQYFNSEPRDINDPKFNGADGIS